MIELVLQDGEGRAIPGTIGEEVTKALGAGKILAIKGVGGYHLCCDALNDQAVSLLRRRKNRWAKPFAVMAPDLIQVSQYCHVNHREKTLLESRQRPIVLLHKKKNSPLPEVVAPEQDRLGVMLPYAPWHQILLKDFSLLVMTSGNLSEEPIVYRDKEALQRLGTLADLFLIHNRPIKYRCDDSVVVVASRHEIILRRSRGYVFRPINLNRWGPAVLACGGEQSNTICFIKGNQAFLSQHIGDLENYLTLETFEITVADLSRLLDINPQVVAYDLHPEYLSTKFALDNFGAATLVGVQHHHAHLASCLADNHLDEPVIGVTFDGTGYGTDGCLWGGEFLVGDGLSFKRWAHLAYVPMPSGSQAIKEPWRMAAGYLDQVFGDALMNLPLEFVQQLPETWPLLQQATSQGINAPLTSSCGRLFDGVAALLCLKRKIAFEGQAAMLLEKIAEPGETGEYPFALGTRIPFVIDWRPLWEALVNDVIKRVGGGVVSARFHNTMARIILDVSILIRKETGINKVVLTGGVFQNLFLLEKADAKLQRAGFEVLLHRHVPPNDGGLALGQALVGLARNANIDTQAPAGVVC